MKRIISVLLAVTMLFGLCVPAFADGLEDWILTFSLDVGGKHEITVETGDVITVNYVIKNENADEVASTRTTQDEIEYDAKFFKLIESSIKVSDGSEKDAANKDISTFDGVTTDYGVSTLFTTSIHDSEDKKTQLLYFNSTKSLEIMEDEPLLIATFQLEILGTTGSSTVKNTSYFGTDTDNSDVFGAQKQDLHVTIAGTPAHTHGNGQKQDGLAPTETSPGYKDYYLCSCNAYFEDEACKTPITDLSAWKAVGGNGYIAPISAVSGAKYYASLTLNDNINVNFKMTHSPEKDKWGDNFQWDKVEVLVDDEPITLELNSKGDVVGVLKKVSPKYIGVPMKIVIKYNGTVEKTIENYSVEKYCRSVCGSESYPENHPLHKLCKAVLNYGKYADDYANSKTTSEVNKGYAIDFTKIAIPVSYQYSYAQDTAMVSEASAHLAIHSDITLVYKIKTVADKTLTKDDIRILNNLGQKVDPANVEITKENGFNVIKIKNIGASKLSRLYTLTLNDSQTFSLTYGVYSYCYGAQTQDYSDTLKTLCKAIYNYGEAAKDYAASLSK